MNLPVKEAVAGIWVRDSQHPPRPVPGLRLRWPSPAQKPVSPLLGAAEQENRLRRDGDKRLDGIEPIAKDRGNCRRVRGVVLPGNMPPAVR